MEVMTLRVLVLSLLVAVAATGCELFLPIDRMPEMAPSLVAPDTDSGTVSPEPEGHPSMAGEVDEDADLAPLTPEPTVGPLDAPHADLDSLTPEPTVGPGS